MLDNVLVVCQAARSIKVRIGDQGLLMRTSGVQGSFSGWIAVR